MEEHSYVVEVDQSITAHTLFDLFRVLSKKGLYQEASELRGKGLRMKKRLGRENFSDRDIFIPLFRLANDADKAGDLKESKKLYNQSRVFLEDLHRGHEIQLDLAIAQVKIANVLRRLKNRGDASVALNRGLDMFKKAMSKTQAISRDLLDLYFRKRKMLLGYLEPAMQNCTELNRELYRGGNTNSTFPKNIA